MDIASLIATIVLGFLSIALAGYFFVQAKDAEKNTSNLLTEIKVQVGQLQKLTARWLDKSIDYFTQRPDPFENSLSAISTFSSQLSETLVTQIAMLIPATSRNTIDPLVTALAVELCHSVGKANYFAQGYLPHPDKIDPENQFYRYVCTSLDSTASRFRSLYDIVQTLNQEELHNANVESILPEIQSLHPLVKSSSEVLISRSSNQPPN